MDKKKYSIKRKTVEKSASVKKSSGKLSKKPVEKETKGIRLNRYIANAGICSRREADNLIKKGEVTVNGKVVTEMGTIVNLYDVVYYNNQKLNAEKKIYLLLNKPKDVVTTMSDPHAKHTVMDIIKGACDERIYPVGRLDRNTTGVLLFTNDGDLAKKLTHPKHLTKKIYHAFLDKPLTKEHILKIGEGVELDDGKVAADAISYVEKDDRTQIGVEIHSGKNHIVRRIFEHLGYKVVKLDRVFFAGLTKKRIPRGKWRMLTPKEISILKAGFWQ